MAPHFFMVDVFAERPYSGNPLAVVVGTRSLPDDTMQRLAREMNFSETTFVSSVPEDDGGYRLRIFTPAREVAFAGHPILGTAWVLRHYVSPELPMVVRLNLDIGQVRVTFEDYAKGRELAWFLAPPMLLGSTCPRERIAQALGIAPDDIEASSPARVISAGTSAMVVPLRNLDALRRSKPDHNALADLAADGFPQLLYLFSWETHESHNDVCARFFFEAHGVREDPATGNGAAFLGAYLLEHGPNPKSPLSVRIEQGHQMGRPSLVMLQARMHNGIREVHVGGYVIPTVRGELVWRGYG